MRKLILFMHTSLDGFVTDKNGGMDWINVNDQMFEYSGKLTDEADTALYGRNTYGMMEGYWPTAAQNPNASKHDIDHSRWYNKVPKIVLSRTMKNPKPGVQVISNNLAVEVQKIKDMPGKSIVIFGSPSAGHSLAQLNLIDDYWLFVNPVLLGEGIPMFKNISGQTKLKLVESKVFDSGVIALHHTVER